MQDFDRLSDAFLFSGMKRFIPIVDAFEAFQL